MAASLSARPSKKILTLSIFTGTVLPLHSTSLIVAACFARVWVISACGEWTEMMSPNITNPNITNPNLKNPEWITLKSEGFSPHLPRSVASHRWAYSCSPDMHWLLVVCCSNIYAQRSDVCMLPIFRKLPPVFQQEDLQCHQTSASSASAHS